MIRPVSRSELSHFQKLKQKKFRREFEQFVGEGLNLFRQVRHLPGWFYYILIEESFFYQNSEEFNGLPLSLFRSVSKKELSELSETETPQPVLFILHNRYQQVQPDFSALNRVLYLFGIQDPGNAGTLLRTATWFGWDAVIFSHDSVEWTNPKVIRSSMGSFATCPVFEDSRENDLLILAGKSMAGYFLDMEGEPIRHANGTKHPICLVVGNESNGFAGFDITSVFSESKKIHIPGHADRVESLNAGIAGSIALFQLAGNTYFG